MTSLTKLKSLSKARAKDYLIKCPTCKSKDDIHETFRVSKDESTFYIIKNCQKCDCVWGLAFRHPVLFIDKEGVEPEDA